MIWVPEMVENEDIYKAQKENLIRFMNLNGLNSNSWAKKAGISEGTLRHFLSGRNKSLTLTNLTKLAECLNVTIEEIIGRPANQNISYHIDRDYFIKTYCEVHDFLNEYGQNLTPEVRANIILSWYEISLLNKNKNKPSKLDDLLTKLAANSK